MAHCLRRILKWVTQSLQEFKSALAAASERSAEN